MTSALPIGLAPASVAATTSIVTSSAPSASAPPLPAPFGGIAAASPCASDASLVVAARARETWAIEALYRRFAPMVNALAFRLMGRTGDVDDLVQESFIVALSKLASLEDPQAFCAWLRAIVVRTAGKMLRKRKVLGLLGLRRSDDDGSAVDDLVATTAPPDEVAELRAVYACVDALPVKVRIPFLLRRVEGMSLPEIAEATGASLATVKRRITDAEEAFARQLCPRGASR